MTLITRFSLTVIFILACTIVCAAQEQSKESANAQTTENASTTENVVGPIDGEGTVGKIPKFTGTNTIGDSIITESSGRVSISSPVAPVATLHVHGPGLASQSGDGTTATPLFQTSGGKGGNTTASGQTGGAGASIFLMAGQGGDAPAGSTRGSGGNITLQPGGMGGGAGAAGASGKVLLAPNGIGRVIIGTGNPLSLATLEVQGGSGEGIHGESTSFVGVHGQSNSYIGVHGQSNSSVGVFGESSSSNGVRGHSSSGNGVFGQSSSGTGVSGQSSSGTGVNGNSNGGIGVHGESTNNDGVFGISSSGNGVHGFSTSSNGVHGQSSSGNGVFGQSNTGNAGQFDGKVLVSGNLTLTGNESFGSIRRQMINLYGTTYGIGVQSNTQYFRTNSGFAWFKGGVHDNAPNNSGGGTLQMRLDSSGNLHTNGAVNPASDRHAKTNFLRVNPRSVLDKLSTLPIQTWNYKAEDNSVRHIGPVAQDFRAAFNLGADDLHISTVDADGVTMAAIQGLYQMMLEKDRQIAELTRRVQAQQAQLNQVRRAIRKKRTARR